MKSQCLIATLVTAASLLTGCNAWQEEPIIDKRGVNQAQYERDLSDCRGFAAEADGTRAVIAGAATGGVIGAAAGAILSDGDAASRGAGAGAILGGTQGALRNVERRQRIVLRCLRGRGYRVLG